MTTRLSYPLTDDDTNGYLSLRDHRRRLMRAKGACCRKVPKCDFHYIAPRTQVPAKPARPYMYFAEGAETLNQKRLLCAGQKIRINDKIYVVLTCYWIGSRPQGKNRWSPLAPFKVLLLPFPLSAGFHYNKIMSARNYVNANVKDIMNPLNPDPLIEKKVCTKLANEITHHVGILVQRHAMNKDWWTKLSIVLSANAKREIEAEETRRALMKRRREANMTRPRPRPPQKTRKQSRPRKRTSHVVCC